MHRSRPWGHEAGYGPCVLLACTRLSTHDQPMAAGARVVHGATCRVQACSAHVTCAAMPGENARIASMGPARITQMSRASPMFGQARCRDGPRRSQAMLVPSTRHAGRRWGDQPPPPPVWRGDGLTPHTNGKQVHRPVSRTGHRPLPAIKYCNLSE